MSATAQKIIHDGRGRARGAEQGRIGEWYYAGGMLIVRRNNPAAEPVSQKRLAKLSMDAERHLALAHRRWHPNSAQHALGVHLHVRPARSYLGRRIQHGRGPRY